MPLGCPSGDPSWKPLAKTRSLLAARRLAVSTGPFKAPYARKKGRARGGSRVRDRTPRDSAAKSASEFDRSLNRTRGFSAAGGAARRTEPPRARAAAPPRPSPPAWSPACPRPRARRPQRPRAPRSLRARESNPRTAPRRSSMSSTENPGRTSDKSPRPQVRPECPARGLSLVPVHLDDLHVSHSAFPGPQCE